MFQKKAGKRPTWKGSNGVAEAEMYSILTNCPDIVTDVRVTNQVNIGYEQHQIGYEQQDIRMDMSNIKLNADVEKKNINDHKATKSRCQTNRIKEDRISTRIVKPVRDTTITRRQRQHERNHHIYDPTKHVKSS